MGRAGENTVWAAVVPGIQISFTWTQAPMGARVIRGLGRKEPSSDSLSLPARNPPPSIPWDRQGLSVLPTGPQERTEWGQSVHEQPRAESLAEPSRPGRVSAGARVPGRSAAEGVLSRGPRGLSPGALMGSSSNERQAGAGGGFGASES